ncbi:hypothetical protein [Cryptosporangium aurantiacum]|uniref:Uncharacterized protein n=1 Tax=Cryptosporangium aurantiacum TaxID=134849 RepID=A0A1M7TY96_9ACTN|nr:hypothetical protein [Cryptosporangium aurantiacum]SHN75655.1 hypothetical protein SAMN05443668_107349 [Cryptosporangium aurantiacum]
MGAPELRNPPVEWWDLLLQVSRALWLTETTAWLHWRRQETIHGIVRAELRLLPVTLR